MYVLIGVSEGHYPEESNYEEKLALFDKEEDAEKYEKEARLKSYNRWCGRGQHYKQYRSKSLLNGYCYARVECYEDEKLPRNPELI